MKILLLFKTDDYGIVSKQAAMKIADVLKTQKHTVLLNGIRNIDEFISISKTTDFDQIFLATYGGWGQDGQLQKILELKGKVFNGQSSKISTALHNKKMTQDLLKSYGVYSPTIYDPKKPKYPCMMKSPKVTMGSKVFRINNESELYSHLPFFADFILEECLAHKEWNEYSCGIVDGVVGKPIRIRSKNGKQSGLINKFAAQDEVWIGTKAMFKKIYQDLGLKGAIKINFTINKKDSRLSVFEIQTMPVLLPESLLCFSLDAIGVSYEDIIKKMI